MSSETQTKKKIHI